MTDKKSVRKSIKAATLELIGSGVAALQEPGIWEAVEAMPAFKAAGTILLYSALPDEVGTADFIRKWQESKRIVLPVVEGDHLLLKLGEHLVHGYMDILEPGPEAGSVSPSEVDFAVIPGVAFGAIAGGRKGDGCRIDDGDGKGDGCRIDGGDGKACGDGKAGGVARLGRGKGYYDRLLPQLHCPTVGVGFSTQWVAELPVDPWDVPLTAVIIGK